MLKVYLADDHNIVAQGLASLIRQISTVDELKVFRMEKICSMLVCMNNQM